MRAGEKRAANLLAFPALTRIPPPEFPLKGAAYDKYMELAKGLLHARKLNTFTRMKCEQFAILHGGVHKRIDLGMDPSRAAVETMGKLMKELQLVDESDSTAPEPKGQENRYSRIGVITRPGTEKAELRPS